MVVRSLRSIWETKFARQIASFWLTMGGMCGSGTLKVTLLGYPIPTFSVELTIFSSWLHSIVCILTAA